MVGTSYLLTNGIGWNINSCSLIMYNVKPIINSWKYISEDLQHIKEFHLLLWTDLFYHFSLLFDLWSFLHRDSNHRYSLFNPHINSFYPLLSFKQHLFDRIGSNTKDHQNANGLDEIDVGSSEVVHDSFLTLAKRHGMMMRSFDL